MLSIPATALICPLDWGLGHASRCIPIIEILLKNHFRVVVAASGNSGILLQKRFPNIEHIKFKGYKIAYSKSEKLAFKLVLQLPKIILRIVKEHYELKKIIRKHDVKIVISDNRFGLWNKKIKSIYITHQIQIKHGKNNKTIERMLFLLHGFFITKYHACLIPDNETGFKLAGAMSSPLKIPQNARYVGLLSRFQKPLMIRNDEFDICAIISGPEPQRSIFQDIVVEQIKKIGCKAVIFLGLPENTEEICTPENVSIFSHLPDNEMQSFIEKSKVIISRSGYSTLMDLAMFGKKVILVPTPGQTEQEYLAGYLSENNLCLFMNQKDLDLKKALEQTENIQPFVVATNYDLLEKKLIECIKCPI